MPEAREIECAVLGNDDPEASVPGEVIPVARVLRLRGQVPRRRLEVVIPADLPPATSDRGPAAVDRRVPGDRLRRHGARRLPAVARHRAIFVNEINTIPGFTTISMYSKMWDATGVDYPALLDRLIALALERHAEKQQLRTSVT